jgi:PAS domain S-box-containing protein
VLALGALVAVPPYFEARVEAAESQITEVLDSAAYLTSSLRLLKSRQLARVEGFLASEDRSYGVPYNAALAEEDTVLGQLRGLVDEMAVMEREGREEQPDTIVVESQIGALMVRLEDASRGWRVYNDGLFNPPLDPFTGRPRVGLEPDARDRVLEGFEAMDLATRALDDAVAGLAAQARRRLDNEARLQSQITVALALAAMVAALILGRLAHRYRSLTIESEVRRRDAVQSRREIDALLEATGDGVLGIDLSGQCISLNRAGSELLGYSRSEILGRDVHETLFHSTPDGSPIPREYSLLLEAVARGKPLESEDGAVIWPRKGESFPARWSLRPMIDGRELRGAVLSFTDMTEIRDKEEALHRAVRQREEVVSIVSHDLRNPLGVALAASDLLLELPLDEQQRRRQAQIIHRSGKRMQHLIDDLLDVSRIEASALVVRPSKEELLPILEEARQLFAHQAEARELCLEVAPASGNPVARVDRDRIIQALSNLLDNAIRLTPEGGRVTMAVEEDGAEVRVSVEDTGPGVKPALLEHLFERFARAEAHEGGSVGLGLTIVKGVAEAHDGTVSVETVQGQGSVFTMRLPKAGPSVGEPSGPMGSTGRTSGSRPLDGQSSAGRQVPTDSQPSADRKASVDS